jgi:signal transduction histidine kinase
MSMFGKAGISILFAAGGMLLRFLTLIAVTSLTGAPALAETREERQTTLELGLPFVRHYSPREYGQAGQNWVLAQDRNGLVYVGNNHGVLVHDGVRWELVRVANHSTVRALAVADDDRIYVGAQRELGYLEPDATGQLRYQSLVHLIPEEVRDFQDVWRIAILSHGIYFATFDRLFRYHEGRFEWWQPETSFHRAFQAGDRLFIRDRVAGLVEFDADGPKPVPGGERFNDLRIDLILPWPGPRPDLNTPSAPEQALLVGTREEGFFLFDGQHWLPWPTEVDHILVRDQLYTGTWMPDGRLALGTTQAGVYFIHADGRLSSQLNQDAGLEDEIVYYLMVDHQGGLWMALDGGIARAAGDLALTRFDSRRGLPGRINTLRRHDGQLYAGTNHDLFVLSNDLSTSFTRVEGLQAQTWDLESFAGELLVANNQGVFRVSSNGITNIRPSERTSFSLLASEKYPGRVYVGLSNGLAVLQRTEQGWQDHGRVIGIGAQVRNMHELDDGRLWLGTARSGVIRLTPPDILPSVPSPLGVQIFNRENFGIDHGLPQLERNFVYTINDQPIFATRAGLMLFDEGSERFRVDPRFENLFGSSARSISSIHQGPDGRIWMHVRNEKSGEQHTGAVVPIGNDSLSWETSPLEKLSGIFTYAIWADADGITWLGGEEGLFRFDPEQSVARTWSFKALIRRVEAEGERVLFGGHGPVPEPILSYTENRIRFDLAAPSFSPRDQIHYQIWLEGQDNDWSDWRIESTVRWSDLWEGRYRLRVRARDMQNRVSEETSFSFQVLPPWYRTIWAYLAAALGLIALGLLILSLNQRRLAGHNRALQQLVRERTSDLEQAKNHAERTLARLQDTQAELIESEKMATVGRLVSGMAHEINTPVSNGRMAATRLQADQQAINTVIENKQDLSRQVLFGFLAECRQGLELIARSFERIGNLVARLHRISGPQDADGMERFRLIELLTDLKAFCAPELDRKAVEIEIDCPDSIWATGNRLILTECLHELIENSLEHGFADHSQGREIPARITISAMANNATLQMDYRDNGAGLAAGVEGRIFEPFGAGMQSGGRHPGLGMHMLYQMIKRLPGGHIENRPAAQGVHFILELSIESAWTP